MVSEWDKKIYFPMTFNEQMAWIDEEVEYILKGKNQKSNAGITMINRKKSAGRVIKRLFKIIKEDPKNISVMREVEAAEKELWAFLEHKPGAKSEEEIYTYWNNYLWAYVAELESKTTYYFLMSGYDECHDGDEWIGIYDSTAQLKNAYKEAVQTLEQEHKQCGESNRTAGHEKIKIHIYHEATGKWHYDIPYEALFSEKNDRPCNEYKAVKIVLDHSDMFMFKREMVKQGRYRDYVCDGMPVQRIMDESISVQFHVQHTHEIFEMMGQWWGGWNDCPDYKAMGGKAQEWQEQYGAELMEISHDTLVFRCRSLTENEADILWRDICQIAPDSRHIKENSKKKILECGEFSLWWD